MWLHHFMHLTLSESDSTAHAEANSASEKLVTVDSGLLLSKV